MDDNKKELLLEISTKIESILKALESNFDVENDEIHDEYSFLSIVKENLKEKISK